MYDFINLRILFLFIPLYSVSYSSIESSFNKQTKSTKSKHINMSPEKSEKMVVYYTAPLSFLWILLFLVCYVGIEDELECTQNNQKTI